jgi:hypothetical protein
MRQILTSVVAMFKKHSRRIAAPRPKRVYD